MEDKTKVKIVYYSGDCYRILYRFAREKTMLEHIFGEQYEPVKYFFSAGFDCHYGVYDALFRIEGAEAFAKQITPEFIEKYNENIYWEEQFFLIERAEYLSKNRPYKTKTL